MRESWSAWAPRVTSFSPVPAATPASPPSGDTTPKIHNRNKAVEPNQEWVAYSSSAGGVGGNTNTAQHHHHHHATGIPYADGTFLEPPAVRTQPVRTNTHHTSNNSNKKQQSIVRRKGILKKFSSKPYANCSGVAAATATNLRILCISLTALVGLFLFQRRQPRSSMMIRAVKVPLTMAANANGGKDEHPVRTHSSKDNDKHDNNNNKHPAAATAKRNSGSAGSFRTNEFPSLQPALEKSDVVALYFAASWCSMSTPVTELLDDEFRDILLSSGPSNAPDRRTLFSLVYISSDATLDSFESYLQPGWKAVPFAHEAERSAVKRHFGTCAKKEMEPVGLTTTTRHYEIPNLIVVSAAAGNDNDNDEKNANGVAVLTNRGIADVQELGGEGALAHWMTLLQIQKSSMLERNA